MNLLVWNVRGLTEESKLILKEHCASFSPVIVGILEPKSIFDDFPVSFWRSINLVACHQNARDHMRSNIWVFTHPSIVSHVILSFDQVIIVRCVWMHYCFKIAVIHGANCHVARRRLWLDLLNHIDGSTVFMGDFNAIKGAHERISNCLPNNTVCQEFRDFITATGFIEPPITGLRFTWSGRRFMPSHVESVLDRAIISDSFVELWHNVSSHALPRITSDHSPLLLMCRHPPQARHNFFKFLHMWVEHPNFEKMVENSWNSQIDVNCPIFKVMAKLKRLRKELRLWNRTGYTDSLFNAEILAQAKINVALSRKSSLLKQKSRVSWLTDGDRNTAFFHAMLKYKKRPHIIPHLDIQGSMVYDQDEIGNHIVDFFSNLFNEDNMEEIDVVALEATIDRVVSPSQNDMLTRIPENDKITAAVFDMDPNSAAGPDGFFGKFFQACWQIIRSDVWNAVRAFFMRSYLPNGCNSNTLVLIPKKDVVNSVTDLRPIVLSNF
ncbi:uncharacterized protein LOC131007339 [Salvia miltiorrhiza]|uniref:uncharacterized protein LOC131007339 n=1 Tax=Salvia miltiorrhiza TaxID=226208 RepID=UPI0025ACB587|nr:uncharacterized protein LOC131007339 [Salvia miltiorrhiza]